MLFHFNWKLSLFVVLCFPLVVSAGFWQIDRANEKLAMQKQLQHMIKLDAVNIQHLNEAEFKNYKNVFIQGRYLEHLFLIDNKTHKGKFGYEVIQAFELDNADLVWVSRGWVQGDLNRHILPNISSPKERITLTGYLYKPSKPVQLKSISEEEGWPKRMQSAELTSLYEVIKYPQEDRLTYLVRLSANSPTAFKNYWKLIPITADKHWGYAVQWFAMAALLLGLFIYSSIKPSAAV